MVDETQAPALDQCSADLLRARALIAEEVLPVSRQDWLSGWNDNTGTMRIVLKVIRQERERNSRS